MADQNWAVIERFVHQTWFRCFHVHISVTLKTAPCILFITSSCLVHSRWTMPVWSYYIPTRHLVVTPMIYVSFKCIATSSGSFLFHNFWGNVMTTNSSCIIENTNWSRNVFKTCFISYIVHETNVAFHWTVDCIHSTMVLLCAVTKLDHCAYNMVDVNQFAMDLNRALRMNYLYGPKYK